MILRPPISPLFPYTTLFRSLFGLLPALQSSRTDLNEALKSGGGTVGVSRKLSRMALATFQVAFSLALLVGDRKSTRLNSSHTVISYAVFCLKKKKKK